MGDKRKFEIGIPCDSEGFYLLQCTLCGDLFKLKPNDIEVDSVFEIHCPACGLVSDNYVTDDVIELAEIMAGNYLDVLMTKEFKKLEHDTKNSILKFKVTGSEAKIKSTLETNNMVMGIDEYLKEEKDIALDFISFRKYYQRIFNRTGSKYKHWVIDIKREYEEYINQYEENTKNKAEYSKGILDRRNSSEFEFMEAQGYKGNKLII